MENINISLPLLKKKAYADNDYENHPTSLAVFKYKLFQILNNTLLKYGRVKSVEFEVIKHDLF